MKAELTLITKEMTGSAQLAEALNNNFDALNETAQNREKAILRKINQMETRIRKLSDLIIVNNESLKQEIIDMLKRAGVNPDLLTED